jgi:hypothetical protein
VYCSLLRNEELNASRYNPDYVLYVWPARLLLLRKITKIICLEWLRKIVNQFIINILETEATDHTSGPELVWWLNMCLFKDATYLYCEPRSSVSIASDYGMDDRAFEVRSPAEAKEFFLYPLCPDRLWGPPSLQYSGYRGSFPRG